jgi:lysophospholipase L1-like esterase
MFFKKPINYDSITKYNNEMRTKRENYTLLNKEHAISGQTVLLGDSITDFFNYYELFYEFSKSRGQAVYNRGISGDTTNRLLERLEENVLCIKPKNLVLLIGTNDIGRGLPLEMTLKNVESVIEKAKASCPEINFILQAVYPINRPMRDAFEKRSNEKIIDMNKELVKLSEKHGCKWLDLTDKLRDETGNLKREFTYDGLHINAKAYKIVAENIIPLLK